MKLFASICLFISFGAIRADGQTVLSPNVPFGNTSQFAPLQFENRLQQVYSASDFNAIAQGAYLTEIALNYQPQVIILPVTASNVLITASTTSKDPDSLSAVFAENSGADEITVFGLGSVNMPSGDQPGFDVVIKLTTPFFYDPSKGNLLLDFRKFGTFLQPNTPAFDAHNVAGDSVSQVVSQDPNASGGALSSVGLVTRFTFEPIPEPSVIHVLALGALCCSWLRLRKRKSHGTSGRIVS